MSESKLIAPRLIVSENCRASMSPGNSTTGSSSSQDSTAAVGDAQVGLSAAALARIAAAVAERETTPGWIGRYRLIEVIGQGGMGEVWRAEQEKPIRRTVALKLIKLGMDTREV